MTDYERIAHSHDPTDWAQHQKRQRTQMALQIFTSGLVVAVGMWGVNTSERMSAVETELAAIERRQTRMEERHSVALEDIRISLRRIESALSEKADRTDG